MASRRAAGSIFQLSARTSVQLQPQAAVLLAPAFRTTPRAPLLPSSARNLRLLHWPIGTRRYSQAVQNKIWNFEDIRKAMSQAKPTVVIVDAREPGELQQTGRIPGAVNIPITSAPDSFFISDEEFEDRFGYPRPTKDAEVVFYCKAGVRSRAAAGLARDAGWTKVGEYPGSWVDWFEKGGKVER